jgi:hypothetical protein
MAGVAPHAFWDRWRSLLKDYEQRIGVGLKPGMKE